MELKIILTELRLSNFVILSKFLHCRMWNLCNQILLQFSMDLFETIHACYRHDENVHVGSLWG